MALRHLMLLLVWTVMAGGQDVNEGMTIHACVATKGRGAQEDVTLYSRAVIECVNGDRDNTECCTQLSISGFCLRMCNGTVPAQVNRDDLVKLKDCPKQMFKACMSINPFPESK